MTNTIRTLQSIQVLRFVAALLVVLYHAIHFADLHVRDLPATIDRIASLGASGVHIFFVISGFIMVWTTHGRFATPGIVGKFAQRRFIRIFPIYWVLGALNLVLLFIFKLGGVQSFSEVLLAAILWPGYSSLLIFVGWTLTYEFFFYIIFAMALFLPERRAIMAVSLLFLVLIATGQVAHLDGAAFGVATNTLLLEFVFGMWIAFGLQNKPIVPKWTGPALVVLGLVGLVLSYWTREIFPSVLAWGLPSACLVAGVVMLELEGRFWQPLLRLVPLGDSSYSLYLVHAMLMPPLMIGFGQSGEFSLIVVLVFAVFASLVCVFAAHQVYRYVERPLINLAKMWFSATPAKTV